MIYETLYKNFKSEFQSDQDVLERLEKESNIDAADGMHVIFSFVVVPYLLELLKTDQKEKLTKAFAYFEAMASSDNTMVTEVLEFTIIENLMSVEQELWESAQKYMGLETKKSCQKIGEYIKR